MYKVPVFCLVNPIEITGQTIPSSSSSSSSSMAIGTYTTNNNNTNNNTNTNNDDQKSPRGIYTPHPRAPGQTLQLRVRINPGDFNLTVSANVSDTLLDFKKLVHQKTMIENEVCT
jgi:hypothetical protein